MSSLLQQTKLPLWAWVLIIVAGSLVVLGTVALIVRFVVKRQRKAGFVDTFGDENLPQRKVTVRRGRIVEQSKYLSLTGSKFGLNAFSAEEIDSRAGARSKSPFEWWSTLIDRSQSRNSQVTQMTLTNDGSSIYGPPTSPRDPRVYSRRDFNHSSTSISSTVKEDDFSVSGTETPALPSPVVKNFSRSFSRQGHYATYSSRQNTLSRIEESSPHTSMISARQLRAASYASHKQDTKSSTPSPLPRSPAAMNFPQPRQLSTQGRPKSRTIETSQTVGLPSPVAYHPDLGDGPTRFSYASSRNSIATSIKSAHRQSLVTALPEPPPLAEGDSYWENRTELSPQRSSSLKKPKVLRKKSLKKAELVTRVDS